MKKKWFNFYSPHFIADQNNDGQKDILILPDGGETYMSISVLPHESKSYKNVIFSTGGETNGRNM